MDNITQNGLQGNSKFPGLSQEQIDRLEQVTANLTGIEKQQRQQALYQGVLQQINQDKINNDRMQAENELYYKSTQEKDPKQQNYLQSNVRQEQLADLVKEKRNLRTDANTQDVINALIQEAQVKGVSVDSLNSYLAGESDDFLYEMGLAERSEPGFWEEAGEIGKNLGAGLLDSALSIPRMAAEAGRFTGKRLASKVKGVDMDELPENEYTTALNKFIDEDSKIANVFGADEESTSYQVGKIGGDIAQTALGGGAVKGAIKEAPGLIGKFGNRLSKSKGTLGKIFQGGIEGAGDMTLFSIIADHKLPSREELGMGAGIGGVIPGAGKVLDLTKNGIKKIASKLELSGMLNPAKLNTIKNSLINEGVDLTSAGMKKGGTAEDVGRRMIERGMQGSKEQIINKLGEHAKKSHALKKEVLGTSETLHNVDSAKKSLEAMYEQVKGVPGLEEKAQRIGELYNKDGLTLSEMDEVKSLLDDTINIYTNAGDVRAGALKEGLDNVRKDLRKYIETEADKEGLGNIRLLNNETQVSKSLQDAISRKDSADAAREMLSIFSKGTIGGALGGTAGGPFDGNTLPGKLGNILVGALAGQFLFSTQAKTKLASLLNKMTGGTKKELERLVNGEVQTVSKGTEKELQKIVEDLNLKEVNPTEFTKEEANRLIGNTDNIVNKTENIVKQEEKLANQVENTVNKSEDVAQKAEQTVQRGESNLVEDMGKHSREENERALKNIQNSLKREEEIINNFDNYKKLGQIADETDPRRQGHLETYNKLKEQESLFKDYLENTVKKAETPKAKIEKNVKSDGDIKPAKVSSPEFEKRFKGSKVVDKDGKPLKVFHGTNADFDTFEKVKTEPGYRFTESLDYAKEHGDKVKEVYLNIKNVADLDTMWKLGTEKFGNNVSEKQLLSNEFRDYLQKKGYDGMVWDHDGKNTYVAFTPDQIKIAKK